jgi:hypothetical protein
VTICHKAGGRYDKDDTQDGNYFVAWPAWALTILEKKQHYVAKTFAAQVAMEQWTAAHEADISLLKP